jgi:hypothetical protein
MGASWLNKCLHEHPECTAKAEQRLPSALPTRVINVGTASQKPFLHVSAEDEVGQWAALSYCWGGDSPFTLNATSFARLRDGLPLEDFPPTLRDAILVVRALEVRYVWIDSLCIFQDDPQDWAFEASMMAKVYEFAVVTVAATSAESVVDGFLGRRDPHFSCGFPWRRRAGVDEDDAYPVVLGGVSRKFDAQLDEDKSRWATRGWTFQEQLLSTRLLCYTTGRMIWYCAAGQAIEPSNDAERRPTLFSELKQLLVSPTMENPGLDSEESPYDIWYRLLSEYSKRRLTFSKDRLPAIAALARMFHARQQDQYVAGLWRDDLTYGLLWSPDDQTDGSVKTAKPLRYALLRYASFYADTESTNVKPVDPAASVQVPSQSHGPSWSWIDSCFSGLRWPPRYEPFTYLARATDVKVTTALPDDSFGSVTSSELVLEAPYQHVNLKLGSYAGPLWNPANLTQRVLSRLGPLAKTRELAQIALTRPGSLASSSTGRSVEAPFSGTQFTLVQVARSDAHRPMIFLLVLQPHAVADGSWGGEGGAREVYRRVARLVLQPWQYDDENSIAEEVMNRLEGEAYAEVAGEGWPRGKFVIV